MAKRFLGPRKSVSNLKPLTDDFDEASYLAAHPDVSAAVAAGTMASGAAHFRSFGQDEGRQLRPEISSDLAEPAMGDDGLPLPSADLMFLVTNGRDKAVFQRAGRFDLEAVRLAIQEADVELPPTGMRVLDWGCGCGRLARHWVSEASVTKVFGCDINSELVDWCIQHLPFGTFHTSSFEPPLAYGKESFDLIYGISVLTHLTFDQHYHWMQEVHRILASGGVAVLTTHGPTLLPQILAGAASIGDVKRIRTHLIDEDAFVCVVQEEGSNATGNVLTGQMFSKIFYPFDVRLHRPRYGLMGIQDTFVITKKAACELTFIDQLTQVDLHDKHCQHTIELRLDGQSNFATLVDVGNLEQSATASLTIRTQGDKSWSVKSASVALPDKVGWTLLDKAYAMMTIENLPAHHGLVLLNVDVHCRELLDGAHLTMSKAILF